MSAREQWAQETAGLPWHRIVDTHRNAAETACGLALINAGPWIDDRPQGNVCEGCDGCSITCAHCNDTHRMALGEQVVMCTRCPIPCPQCARGGNGAYCERTRCSCTCHKNKRQRAMADNFGSPSRSPAASPHFCEHANEVPQLCRCPRECYCRQYRNTCFGADYVYEGANGAPCDRRDVSPNTRLTSKPFEKVKLNDPRTREVWETVERAKAEVAGWPAWKRGDEAPASKEDAMNITDELNGFTDVQLPLLLECAEWKSLDIDYEHPRVERLWMEWYECRIYIHYIHAIPRDARPLYHPHPWPSAVRLLLGGYSMDVGYGAGTEPPPVASSLYLARGSTYEMTNPDGWHAVRPERDVLSVMLTREPWSRVMPASAVPKKPLRPLATHRVRELIAMTQIALQPG